MNLPQDELTAFLHLSLVILLPMVPAYVLFKALPGSADVSGPLQGLNIKLGGAFAGYFALLVLVFSTHNIWNPVRAGQIWQVKATLLDENGAVIQSLDPNYIGLDPNTFDTNKDGSFTLTVATQPTQGGAIVLPSVTVSYPSFQQPTIALDPADPSAGNAGLVRDERSHVIRIPPIRLKRLPEYSAASQREQGLVAAKGTQP